MSIKGMMEPTCGRVLSVPKFEIRLFSKYRNQMLIMMFFDILECMHDMLVSLANGNYYEDFGVIFSFTPLAPLHFCYH